jgi:hypothetical protein
LQPHILCISTLYDITTRRIYPNINNDAPKERIKATVDPHTNSDRLLDSDANSFWNSAEFICWQPLALFDVSSRVGTCVVVPFVPVEGSVVVPFVCPPKGSVPLVPVVVSVPFVSVVGAVPLVPVAVSVPFDEVPFLLEFEDAHESGTLSQQSR